MESLLEDQPKNDDDSRVEMQDPDHSYYVRFYTEIYMYKFLYKPRISYK